MPRKNTQKMKYSLQLGTVPKYVRDKNGNIRYETYTDSDGNEIFILNGEGEKIPLETGETEILYSLPIEFLSSLSMSGGEAQAREFGLDLSAYDAVALVSKNSVPIVEGSLIWVNSEVEYEDVSKTRIKPISADFSVVSVRSSINFVKFILKAVVK